MAHRKIRKLLIVSEYMGERYGPAGMVVKKYVEAVAKYSNVTVDVVTSDFVETSGTLYTIDRHLTSRQLLRKIERKLSVLAAGYPKVGLWGIRARQQVNSLLKRTADYDAIIAWSNPISSLFACVPAAIRYNVPLVWRVDDPYPPCYYPSAPNWSPSDMYDEFETEWLKKTAPFISYLSAPSYELGDWMRQKLANPGIELLIWPHIGGDGSDSQQDFSHSVGSLHANVYDISKGDESVINLAHFGRLSDNRNPSALIETLISINGKTDAAVHLHLYGSLHRRWGSIVEAGREAGVVITHGSLPYTESLLEMKQYDALVLIEAQWEYGVFLPSKFADYVWAQRPLLLMTPKGSVVEKAVGGQEFPGLLGYSRQSMEDALYRFISVFRSGSKMNIYIPDSNTFNPSQIAVKSVCCMQKAIIDRRRNVC